VSKEVRTLIFRMAAENPTWGAARIHGELLKLGFNLSETTVSRWLRRIPKTPDPGERWLTFLRNHRDPIAAMDFFTVPTLTFSVLYCFFVIGHDRRKILRFNVTRNPNAERQSPQIRDSQTHKRRSTGVNRGRFLAERCSTPIWWRRAKFSSSMRAANIEWRRESSVK
jgi:hypothetical protein